MQISEILLINRKRAGDHIEQKFKTSLQRSRNLECKIFGCESGIAKPPTGFVCGCAETWKFRLSNASPNAGVSCWIVIVRQPRRHNLGEVLWRFHCWCQDQ